MRRLTRRTWLVGLGVVLAPVSCSAPATPSTRSSPTTAPDAHSAESPTTVPAKSPSAAPTIRPTAPTPRASAPALTTAARAGATTAPSPSASGRVLAGIDVLLNERLDLIRGKRLGLVTNATGITAQRVSDIDALHGRSDLQLVALFAPEHGLRGDAADGASIASSTDSKTGLPIYSLYGQTTASRRPTAEMLKNVDVLLFDIQDVGARYYTFISTLAYVMQAAARYNKRVVVLDRPNPIGGVAVEGPVLEPGEESFVGLYPIPVRHGMTVGELANLFNREFGIQADLAVVPVANWRRRLWFDQTGLPWVNPSPNIRDLEEAGLYAGVGLVEATNVAEGRGTALPFKNVGAPWIDGERWSGALGDLRLPGITFQPTRFTPSASKYAGKSCGGVLMHLADRESFRAVESGLQLLATAHRLYPDRLTWESGFRLMIGNTWVQQRLVAGAAVADLVRAWEPRLAAFRSLRERYLLYPV